jgi:hypothetical protein
LRAIVHFLYHVASERERLVLTDLARIDAVFVHVLTNAVRVSGAVEHECAELHGPFEQFVIVLVDLLRFQSLSTGRNERSEPDRVGTGSEEMLTWPRCESFSSLPSIGYLIRSYLRMSELNRSTFIDCGKIFPVDRANRGEETNVRGGSFFGDEEMCIPCRRLAGVEVARAVRPSSRRSTVKECIVAKRPI